MGKASPVIAAATWEISRRCVDRKFLLRPDAEVRSALLYCFAFTCEKYQMLLHALTLMDNHYHGSVSDPLGNRNDFVWELHGLIAKCIKKIRGKNGKDMDGPVWDPNVSYGRQWMASEAAFIESIVYIIANPVTAGLVKQPEEWAGFTSSPQDMLDNRCITVARPEWLDASYPRTATLRFSVPVAFGDKRRAFVDAVKSRLKERVKEVAIGMKEAGRDFIGIKSATDVSPFDSPKTSKKKNVIRPQFRAVTRTAILHAKRTIVAWHRAYRVAFEAFRRGNRKVEWPAGTWWFARYAGVNVAPISTWYTLGAS